MLSMTDGVIRFRYKHHRDHDRMKVMALQVEMFIRRFLLHILPKGLMRIRFRPTDPRRPAGS
ncbi:MAG: transposase [gamma proteobacterium endosymbiont of Lamellibrachia anaximandri]|nr:transposase [gamma proteobacterium endosymbiont of Lamellibrachia anaximandri]MBL3535055.1 transposase [gamma proteobacterium endosymbiont of Lamellibrachia anaximandri]